MPSLDFAATLNPVLSELYRDLAHPQRARGIAAAVCCATHAAGMRKTRC